MQNAKDNPQNKHKPYEKLKNCKESQKISKDKKIIQIDLKNAFTDNTFSIILIYLHIKYN